MTNLVSVIIPTFNRFELVQKAIHSVLNQTYKNIELIVVDDCSTDNRYSTFINSSKFKFIQLQKHSGLPAVLRNLGIKESKGDWIAFLDDDDFFMPNKIDIQAQLTNQYDFLCCDAYCDENLKQKYAKGLYLKILNKFNPKNTNHLDFDIIQNHNLIINSSVLVKKDLLIKTDLITENIEHRRIEDYHTWLKLLRSEVTHCRFIEEPLLYYNTMSQKL